MSYQDDIRFPYLRLNNWTFKEWFLPIAPATDHPVFQQIDQEIEAANIHDHPFFDVARHSRTALELWVAQELVISNAFSQIVLAAASRMVNVHLRSMLADIAFGEHGKVILGIAHRAHPWLLKELVDSMGLDATQVRPTIATLEFISALANSISDELAAIAWIGIGNETLILREYSAVRNCFASSAPDTAYAGFLDANLAEDISHSRVCRHLAATMLAAGADPNRFATEATASIKSRVDYLNALLGYLC